MLWTLGGEYDGPHPWRRSGRWRPDHRRVRQVAEAVDTLPFSGALMAIGLPGTFDPWTMAASIAPVTERMRFLIAAYPGVMTPTQLALAALSLDHVSDGRLMINVVGSNPVTMAAHGLHLEKDQRYRMLSDYWNAFRTLYAGQQPPASELFPIERPETFLSLEPRQTPHPPLWGAAGSPEGLQAVVPLVDTYLAAVGTPTELAQRTALAAEIARQLGRPVPSFGVSIGVLVRETEDEAWAEAERKLAHVSIDEIKASKGWQAALAADPATADARERRCIEAIEDGRMLAARDLEFYPNMWNGPIDRAGIDLRRLLAAPNSMLIGDPRQVAERMREIQTIAGIDRFIIWAPPFHEEAYRVADLLLPQLDLDARLAPAAAPLGAVA
ncbi:LLM class flavin-dependent oxidoreductase [Conexibacter stalactiti]|uniref:LLM class flavin-dependent oxidoreductase n=1 Tax=Conexibacter stalactiti TaxID=1940611 RepID=A0ABU4HJE2_9ACTN|nr:LLM class flavin-dependent oxidoreductase [Conexibacter stalactiti]MDW5593431.1 LLM class flavin-dependent oxidoreductase [Conexibacter stalactiti]MEC5034072.1 LLM class flavin-dependent oxidoreductase [Conexibacter stalactiti]